MATDELKQADKEQVLALFELSQAINSILEPEVLFNRVMDIAVATTKAERGFLLARDQQGRMRPMVARNMDREDIENPSEVSRTAIRQALETGQAVLASDAASDPRFADSQSIRLYNIRSILCVPMEKQGQVVGLIFVDSRTSANVFSEKDKVFLSAFANIAAVALENAKLQAKLREENQQLKREISQHFGFENLIGQAPAFRMVLDLARRVAESDVPVLIQGESGTGKELVARAIHHNGPRRERKFVAQYCGAVPETLLESELFGYKKGAFTGALEAKPGLFEIAHGGTFFLDEVADISPSIQAKLLRILQDGEMRRLGETESIKVDVRIISASNRDVLSEVKQGRFREDLFYRLNVVAIKLPPLRERKEDIPLLVEHFLKRLPQARAKGIREVERKAMKRLMEHHWPGNVRELENVLSYAAVMSRGGVIKLNDLPQEILEGDFRMESLPPGRTMKDVEREYILATLRSLNNDRKRTAQQLGISLRTLQYKLKEYKTHS